MNGRPPFDTVVIGCGDIAVSQHLPVLARDDRFRVVAVADPVEERAANAAKRFPVGRTLSNAVEALALGPDVAVIATPPQVTPELAGLALEAGAHVLCEKPIAVSIAAADRLVERAAATDRVFQVGFKNRFSPLVEALRELVVNGRLGHPLVVRIGSFDEAYRPADTLHTERIRGFLEHGPPVVHDGAHAADLLGWLLGPPARVTASALRSDPDFPTANYHTAAIEYDDGSLARLEVGWWFPHHWESELQVYGPRGAADLSRPAGLLRFHDGNREEQVRCDEDWLTICFRRQLDGFAEAIETGLQRGADADAGRAALDLTLAVAEAAASGRAVRPGTTIS